MDSRTTIPIHNNHKKKKKLTPEAQFRSSLDLCSKTKDLAGAVSLFESALSDPASIRLSLHHFNSLLYVCSNSVSEPSAVDFGFRVYDHMVSGGIKPAEATVTAVARLAAARNDGKMAFELAKGVGEQGKLRTYGPALGCFCRNGEADLAYQVEEHMVSLGLHLEETELAELLKVSIDKGREEKVYEYLHKLRGAVRGVSETTAEIIEKWFGGEVAAKVGLVDCDVDKVKEAFLRNGGGWHGIGWLGTGRWIVQRSNIGVDGSCCGCREQLYCVDIDTEETQQFEQSLASLAMEREVETNFKEFQDWIEHHSGYEAVVDGANIGFYQQNFAEGGFSVTQLAAVVKELHQRSKKWPLVILHKKRVRELLDDASNRELLEEWTKQGIIYNTPYGSNDDWYWLFAAVRLKCLLVTNDEMRDHIFELLGRSFFLRWKERHQVRYTFLKGSLKLEMPPSYSVVIQESERGSWHVPLSGETTDESSRTWLCIHRPDSIEASRIHGNAEASEFSQLNSDNQLPRSCKSENLINGQAANNCSDSPCASTSISGKRKTRSPSPSRPG